MGNIERRYGIAGEAAGKAALEYGAGRKATDAFVLSRIARAVVDALEADDRGAVDLLREVADSGAVLVDDRLSWVEVQIDRETWGALVAYRSGGQ